MNIFVRFLFNHNLMSVTVTITISYHNTAVIQLSDGQNKKLNKSIKRSKSDKKESDEEPYR